MSGQESTRTATKITKGDILSRVPPSKLLCLPQQQDQADTFSIVPADHHSLHHEGTFAVSTKIKKVYSYTAGAILSVSPTEMRN